MNLYLVFFVIYLVVMLLVGVFTKDQAGKSMENYFVASRSLGLVVLMGTLVGTALGGSVTMGTVGMAYTGGYWNWLAALAGALGYWALAIMTPKLYKTKGITTPDILAERFGPAARYVASIFNLLFNIVVVAGQIISMGIVVQSITGMSFNAAMVVTTVVFAIYTIMGGMYAVAYTDVIQSVFILGGLLYVLVFVMAKVGGFGNALAILHSTAPPEFFDLTAPGFTFLSSYFAYTIFGIITMQIIHQRIFAAVDEKNAKKAMYSLLGVIVLVYIIPPMVGMSARVLMPGLADPQSAIPMMIKNMMPPFAGALVFISLISVMMSTADSTLLSLASNIVKDFWIPLKKETPSSKSVVIMSKTIVIVMAVISLIVAVYSKLIMPLMVFRLTVLAAGIALPLLAALYWKRVTAAAGLVSMIGGGASTIIWELLKSPGGFPSIFVGLPVCAVLLAGISLIQSPPEKLPEWLSEEVSKKGDIQA